MTTAVRPRPVSPGGYSAVVDDVLAGSRAGGSPGRGPLCMPAPARNVAYVSSRFKT